MSDRELRLRLQVRRHGLPEVNLLWNAPAGPDSTIAKLVEKVNEVIPLEGGDWGLEDYTVELKGADGTAFECLHFQQVSKVLKEDDQVIIRSLLSDDLRLRRASGRHQITTDGRHLVDGVAYGRRWLNAPRNRPLVTLPPRKRAKIEVPDDFDDEEDGDEEAEAPLLLEYHNLGVPGGSRRTSSVRFKADFDDADDVPEDNDFEPGHPDIDMDMDQPLSSEEDDAEHADRGEESDWDDAEDDLAAELQALREDLEPEESFDQGSLIRIEKTRLANQGAKSRLRKRKALEISSSSSSGSESDPEAAAEVSAESGIVNFGVQPDKALASSSSVSSSSTSEDSEDSDRNEPTRAGLATVGKIADESSSDSSSSSSSDDESEDEATVIRHHTMLNPLSQLLEESSEDSSSEDSSDDSSISSSSDSDSDGSESESSSSESDSEPEEVSSKPLVPHKISFSEPGALSPSDKGADTPSTNNGSIPGQGMRKTQRRNLRRRLAKQHSGKGALGEGEAGQDATPESSVTQQDEEFEARKRALLKLMDLNTPEKARRIEANKEAVASNAAVSTSYAPESFPAPADDPKSVEEESQLLADAQEVADSSPSEPRRLRLNMNAGRRMLLGALGLRNPKTKADEDKLRGDLMKNVRPHRNPRTEEEKATADGPTEPEPPQPDEDPDVWRQKINYRAVECCDEDVELSEPPFPFVQRWDPQQQYQPSGKKNGGKRKRNKAHQTEDADQSASTKKQKTFDEMDYDDSWAPAVDDTTAFEDTTILNYDDPPAGQANDSQFSDIDDLPSLPADLTALPNLSLGEAKPGTVITWKHLLLSAQTNWQPEMVDVTAIVVRIDDEEGKSLRLLLAKRDREQHEKLYDEHTGERIYDRFEAPDVDDDEDEAEHDDGYRDVAFSDLAEAKIVQQPLGTQEGAVAVATFSDNLVTETQPSEMQMEAPTSAQVRHETQASETNSVPVEEPEADDDVDMGFAEAAPAPRSPSLGHEIISQTQLQEDNLPAEEVPITVAITQEEIEDTVVVKENPEDAEETANGEQGVSQDSIQPSESASVPSGRQPDPHVHLNLGNEAPAPAISGGEDDISQDPTPVPGPTVETPCQAQPDDPNPSSESSFPPLDEVWATATTTRAKTSPSQAAVESALKGRGATAPLEARFQLIESEDPESSPATARKQLFPNSTQPSKATIRSPLTRKRATQMSTSRRDSASAFVVPEGSQVVALSSDSSSPSRELPDDDEEAVAESKDKGKAAARGSSAKKATSNRKTTGKQKQRAGGMPSGPQRKTRRGSLPTATTIPGSKKKKGNARRATSGGWDGEI